MERVCSENEKIKVDAIDYNVEGPGKRQVFCLPDMLRRIAGLCVSAWAEPKRFEFPKELNDSIYSRIQFSVAPRLLIYGSA